MKRMIIPLVHAGYWMLFALLLLTFYFFAFYIPSKSAAGIVSGGGFASWTRLMTGFAIIPAVICFYTFYYLLFERFLQTRRYGLFIIASILTALLAAIAGSAVASLPFFFGPKFLFGDGYHSLMAILLLMTALAWINGIIAAIIRGCISWFLEMRLKDELRQKTRDTELALVRSQIDPHFLFNTLNNIDILIAKDADAASRYLNILSGMLRFLLYETASERVKLVDELSFVHDYLELQKIRTAHEDYVHFDCTINADNEWIAPMILLPFIENAFKHTANHKAKAKISIRLQMNQDRLHFFCRNTMLPAAQGATTTGGLGNGLVKERLRLLYPERHSLVTETSENYFTLTMDLQL